MTAPDDMSVALSESRIEIARENYETFIRAKLQREHPNWTEDKVEQQVSEKVKRPPERVYREALNETEGVLIIYLFDTHYVFKPSGDNGDDEYQSYVAANNLNLDTPLVGLALGFPPIQGNIGKDYLVREDYELEEFEDDDLPFDAREAAID